MNETSKSIPILNRLGLLEGLTGYGIDIGCGRDPLKVPHSVTQPWDMILGHGDAFSLPGVKNEQFDWVFSSHCLEDSADVPAALKRWSEVLKPGGLMIILVPSWFLYEHRVWPSRGNGAHKASFDIFDCIKPMGHPHYALSDMIRIGRDCGLSLEDASIQCHEYDFTQVNDKSFDQTRHGALAQCMFVYSKV